MKNILIALDYSPTAQIVAETGHDLAKAMNAQVILLHVTSDASYYSALNYSPIMGFGGFDSLDVQADDVEELKKKAQDFLEKSKRHLGDDTIRTVVRSGVFAEAILHTAAEVGAHIIVMGTHSQGGLEKILVGSVAERVLHHSSIPLLIIPTRPVE